MRDKNSNKLIATKGVLIILFLISMFSCILKVKECPLPTCEIRKMHRHLLIFSDTPKDKKKLFGSKKTKQDSTSNIVDSTATTNDSSIVNISDEFSENNTEAHSEKHKHNKDIEHEASYIEVDGKILDEEGNEYIDPKLQKKKEKAEKKKAKKLAKKQKKTDRKTAKSIKKNRDSSVVVMEPLEIDDDEDDQKYAGMTEEEYKHHRQHNTNLDTTHMHQFNEKELAKQLKKEDKANEKKQRKENRIARKGKKGQSDHTRLYRSRITKWWKKDQNPKIGKYFNRQSDSKAPKKKLLERFKK